MSLIPCRECGAQVSSEAETCPHCGIARPNAALSDTKTIAKILAPEKKLPIIGKAGIVVLVILAAVILTHRGGDTNSNDPASVAATKDEEIKCAADLRCLAEKQLIAASIRCRPIIERLAKNNFEWTDSWSEQKLSRFRWKDQSAKIITYLGDTIKFQNGFGAWILSTYECDYDAKANKALDARAWSGRLSD